MRGILSASRPLADNVGKSATFIISTEVVMTVSASTHTAPCPLCDAGVPVGANPALAELVRCRECGSELEITALDPTVLAEAPTEEEDWGE